jgi:hypothetical protein
MASAHCIESLQFEVDFGSAEEALDDQERVAAFARSRAPRIIDEVFDEFSHAGRVWRFESLEIDLGGVERDAFEEVWEARLRERLAQALQEEQQAALGGLAQARLRATGADYMHEDTNENTNEHTNENSNEHALPAQQHSREQAQLDTLLYFLRRGHLPWHAPQAESLASPLDQLAHEVLRDSAPALVAAWRESPEAHTMVQRAVRQFSPTWLARLAKELAQTLGAGAAASWGREANAWVEGFALLWGQSRLPSAPAPHLLWQGLLTALWVDAGVVDRSQPLQSMVQAVAPALDEQATIWRALQAVARRAVEGTPPAPTATLSDDVLQTCLAAHVPALGESRTAESEQAAKAGSRSDEQARLHLRLQAWFDPHTVADDNSPWLELLNAEPSWARQTLLQLGRSVHARRRMAQALPPATLLALTALWLAPAEQSLLQAALSNLANPALWGNAHAALEPALRWELTLSHLLLHPAPALFNAPDYLDSMLQQRSERENRPVQDLLLELAAAWHEGAAGEPGMAPPHALMQSWLQLRLPAAASASTHAALRRNRLEAALAHGVLAGVEDAWFDALSADAAWLQDLLRRVGRSPAMQRRMAREWSAVARTQLIGLWLPATDRAVVIAAMRNPAFAALAGADETRPALYLWEDLLAHLLRLTPGTFFNADAYVRGLQERLAPAHRATADLPGRTAPALARQRVEAALALGSLQGAFGHWDDALRHDATWLRHTLRHVGRSPQVRRRMAHEWSESALLQLLGLLLHGPEQAFVNAVIHSPAFAVPAEPPQCVRNLWEYTLAHLLLAPDDAFFDAQAYVRSVLQQKAGEHGLSELALARITQPLLPADPGADGPAGAALRRWVVENIPAPYARQAFEEKVPYPVIPAKAGIHDVPQCWIPAFAGMTERLPSALFDTSAAGQAQPQAPSSEQRPSDNLDLTTALLRDTPLSPEEVSVFALQLERLLHAPQPTQRRAWLNALESPLAARRLVALLPARQLNRLLQWLRPDEHAAVQSSTRLMHAACQDMGAPVNADALTHLQWQFVLRELFEEGRRFEPAGFAVRLAQHLVEALHPPDPQRWLAGLAVAVGRQALPSDVPASRQPEPAANLMALALAGAACSSPPVAAEAPAIVDHDTGHDAIYVGSAGLVLAGAYMQRLFSMLGLADDKAFVSPQAAERAVHLLQYLAAGSTATPEPQLVLNKVLCGLPLHTPVLREFIITPQEMEAIDGLLRAMIAHWKIIGNTTVEGLRESFLQREGRLSRDDDGWQLQVEPRSFDMLLDQLPWGFSLLKFPWMERPLHVEWR